MNEQAKCILSDISSCHKRWLLELNNSCAPAMNKLTEDEITELLARATLARLVFVDDKPAGALIAIAATTEYKSDNFQWFKTHYSNDNFLYIDRVMVESDMRKFGLGTKIYEDAVIKARDMNFAAVVCEVNEIPPNPESMGFHTKFGFIKLESSFNKSHNKQVAMLHLPL